MERELRDLPPKDAYCLAALPAIYQVRLLCAALHRRSGSEAGTA